MQVTITHNTPKNGIEIRFAEKPEELTRDFLKARRFRFSRGQGLWYNRFNVSLMREVQSYFGVKPGTFDGEEPAIQGMGFEAENVRAES